LTVAEKKAHYFRGISPSKMIATTDDPWTTFWSHAISRIGGRMATRPPERPCRGSLALTADEQNPAPVCDRDFLKGFEIMLDIGPPESVSGFVQQGSKSFLNTMAGTLQ
jgi:hypothetical protein